MNEPHTVGLNGLRVLVTRPAHQAASLADAIRQAGGAAILFPTLEIVPVQPPATSGRIADLILFISANAVTHGARHVRYDGHTRFAAVGHATAAAMRACGLPDPVVPTGESSSEGLLAESSLALPAGTRVLLVRGVGGRELLPDTLRERGHDLEILEVYRRQAPAYTPEQVRGLEERWCAGELDVVTATSAEALKNLHRILSRDGLPCFMRTPLVVVSERIAATAATLGHEGICRVARGASEQQIVDAIASIGNRN